jgi:flagella basal body P-ring formation protein FlgA
MQPNRSVTLIFILILVSVTATGTEIQPMAPVYEAIHSLLKQKLDQNLKNPNITIQEIGKRTRMPRCRKPLQYRLLQPQRVGPGRHTVIVQCPEPAWKLFIAARIKAHIPVVVSTAIIPRHSLIRPEQLQQRIIDTTGLPHGALHDPAQAVGMRARRAIAPGTIIKAQMLLPPYWVYKGKPVMLITRIGNIEVRARGIAQKNAVENEMVAVKNERSGKIVRGIVTAPNTVVVP